MHHHLNLVSFINCCLYSFVLSSPPSTLKIVSVVYRHGDRSPSSIYPLDINQADAWPDGLGWLTNLGKIQQFELGKYVKERYDGFINTSYYSNKEILVQSSGVNRCLMSAYCHLAGLYTPQGSQIWNPDLLWQPIPVLTTPVNTDNKLALGASCARYDQLLEEVMFLPEIQKVEEENKAFYEMIENSTGIKEENIKEIWSVADTLFCERTHNMTWNDWATQPGVWEKIDSLNSFSSAVYTYTTEMARLTGGPLLKEIISNMESASKQDVPLPKFYMYSAHDTTISALLAAMKVFERHVPMYRALVMVELHELQENYVVKILYRNDTTKEPYELTPPGCQYPCKLEDFISLMKPTVPVDWYAECKPHTSLAVKLSRSSEMIYILLLGFVWKINLFVFSIF